MLIRAVIADKIRFNYNIVNMEGKVCTVIKEKSHYLMTVFIVLQGLVFLQISVIMFAADVVQDLKFEVYGSLILFLFYGYMVHFAYHSIQKAYYLELISFLIMSTVSSVLSVITLFYFSFDTRIVNH